MWGIWASHFSGELKKGEKICNKPFTTRKKAGWKQLMSILRMRTQVGLMTAKIAMASSQFKETDYIHPLYVYDTSRADETDLDK